LRPRLDVARRDPPRPRPRAAEHYVARRYAHRRLYALCARRAVPRSNHTNQHADPSTPASRSTCARISWI
jgi:hypothetical protein